MFLAHKKTHNNENKRNIIFLFANKKSEDVVTVFPLITAQVLV